MLINQWFIDRRLLDLILFETNSKINPFSRVPNVTVDDESGDLIVPDDEYDVFTLDISRVPIYITLTRILDQYVVDATQIEEASSISSIIMSVDPSGAIKHIKKLGSGSLHPDPLKGVLSVSKSCSKINILFMISF